MTEKKKRPEKDFDRELANFTDRQQQAVDSLDSGRTKFLLYGGALGGGKSYFLRWYAVRYLMMLFSQYGMKYVTVMIACEDYPSLKDRQLQKIAREFPEWLGFMYSDHKDFGRSFILDSAYGNGVICFRNLDDASKYASAEFAGIFVDELTKNDYDTFTHLRTRLRWPGLDDLECPFIGGTNPGGVGHGWVKQLWMDTVFPDEFIYPKDYRDQFDYIPSKADDNPYLDASYWAMLNTLPSHIRGAFRDGNWDVFAGQAFQEWSSPHHIIKPLPVPEHAPLYMTYDWGFGKPFSIGWWWVDTEGRVYRFDEWYGWNGTPDQGLRLTDSAVAEGIIRKEKQLGIWDRQIIRLAGFDCFNKKPNYRGGGQAPPTAEVFKKYKLILRPTDSDRMMKVKQFRERLRIRYPDLNALGRSFELFPVDGGWSDTQGRVYNQIDLENKAQNAGVSLEPDIPMMQVYETCQHFIRTIPALPQDKINIEDVDTKAEDHVYDEACHICVARPIGDITTSDKGEEREKKRKSLTNVEKAAFDEINLLRDTLEDEEALRVEMIEEIFDYAL